MIDSEYNVWLIEVNTNPCLEESSELLKVLLPRMIGTRHFPFPLKLTHYSAQMTHLS